MNDTRPWRDRNLERIDEARRILQQARKANSAMSEPTAPDEPEVTSIPPEPEPAEDETGD